MALLRKLANKMGAASGAASDSTFEVSDSVERTLGLDNELIDEEEEMIRDLAEECELPTVRVRQLKIIFSVISESGTADDAVDMEEFEKAFAPIFGWDYDEEMLRLLFNGFDVNKDRDIELEEFVHIVAGLGKEGINEVKIQFVFAAGNLDEDGYLTRSELQRFIDVAYRNLGHYLEDGTEMDPRSVLRSANIVKVNYEGFGQAVLNSRDGLLTKFVSSMKRIVQWRVSDI